MLLSLITLKNDLLIGVIVPKISLCNIDFQFKTTRAKQWEAVAAISHLFGNRSIKNSKISLENVQCLHRIHYDWIGICIERLCGKDLDRWIDRIWATEPGLLNIQIALTNPYVVQQQRVCFLLLSRDGCKYSAHPFKWWIYCIVVSVNDGFHSWVRRSMNLSMNPIYQQSINKQPKTQADVPVCLHIPLTTL